jgi:hypothetical protein
MVLAALHKPSLECMQSSPTGLPRPGQLLRVVRQGSAGWRAGMNSCAAVSASARSDACFTYSWIMRWRSLRIAIHASTGLGAACLRWWRRSGALFLACFEHSADILVIRRFSWKPRSGNCACIPPRCLRQRIGGGGRVIITGRGRPRAVLTLWEGSEGATRPGRNPAFGLWADRDEDVDAQVRRLRAGRALP